MGNSGAGTDMSQLMAVRQLAEFLQVSTEKVYELAQAGEIPTIRIGQQWPFNQIDFENWLESRTTEGGVVKARRKGARR